MAMMINDVEEEGEKERKRSQVEARIEGHEKRERGADNNARLDCPERKYALKQTRTFVNKRSTRAFANVHSETSIPQVYSQASTTLNDIRSHGDKHTQEVIDTW